jgi:hypothetical protein
MVAAGEGGKDRRRRVGLGDAGRHNEQGRRPSCHAHAETGWKAVGMHSRL